MRRILATLVAAVVVTVSCGGNNSPDEASTEQAALDDPIRVLYSPNSEQLALFVAHEAGLFEDRGLNVSLEEGTQIEVALVGNSADLGLSTAPDVLQAAQQDVPLVFAAGGSVNTPDNPRLFLVAGASSGIESVADLEGARVAVPGRGSFAELGIAILIEEQGVDPDSVTWVELPFPQMADALNEGTVDAVVTVVPFVNFMESEGHTALVDASDLGAEVPIAILAARRDWAASHSESLRELREALDEAAELIEEDPDYAKEVEEEYTGLPPDIVSQIPFTTFSAQVTEEQVGVWIDILEQRDLIEPGLDAASLIVPSPS